MMPLSIPELIKLHKTNFFWNYFKLDFNSSVKIFKKAINSHYGSNIKDKRKCVWTCLKENISSILLDFNSGRS